MIYLIVAESNKILEALTDMGEAIEDARHFARGYGDMVVADTATDRKLIVKTDGKAIDMDANMRAMGR